VLSGCESTPCDRFIHTTVLALLRALVLAAPQRLAAVCAQEPVAAAVARYIALRRSPDTIDKLYALYSQLTPADIQAAARKYLTENNRTIVTLTGAAEGGGK